LATPMDQERVFDSGQIVSGRYRIVRFLNQGGMGEVYAAVDLELHEELALKTLRPEIAADSRNVARFKHEIQLSRKVAHPNVCRVYDLARDPVTGPAEDATFFLTMELLPGETLEARVRRAGRLPPEDALPLIDQMAAALDAAHQVGIIHRDFKPGNVILVPSSAGERAVVTDFGLARGTAVGLARGTAIGAESMTRTLTGHLMGTPEYMAPELFSGCDASVASDVYALGKTISRIALPALAGARRAGTVAAPDDVTRSLDPQWESAIQRALDPDPARRFSSAGELAWALHGETAADGGSAMTRRKVAGAAAATATLLVGSIAWWIWSNSRNRPSAEAMRLYEMGTEDVHAAAYYAATKALQQAVNLDPGFNLAHARLVEAWMGLEESDKAGREMLLARRGGASGLTASQRLQLDAIDLSITREFPAAAAKYQQLLKTAGAAKGDIYLDLGDTYDKAGQQPKALENYLLAVQNSPRNPAAWLRLAGQHSLTSQSAEAQEEFNQAEALYQVTSNLEGLTEVEYQRSENALRRGKLEEGAAHAHKALQMAITTGNIHQQIRAKLQLGSNAYLSGNPVVAGGYAIDAIATAQANHIESLAVRGVLILGNADRRKRDYDGAGKHYREGLNMARRNNSQRLASVALLSLASLHQEDNRSPDDAEREAREALAFFQPNHFAKESCQCLAIIGRVQRDRGDPAALDSFQQCLLIAEQAQDAYQMWLAHDSLGRLLTVQERFLEAQRHHRQELQLSTEASRIGYAALHCAEAMWPMGQYEEAGEMLAKAESHAGKYPNLRVDAALIRAAMLLSQRRFTGAFAIGRKALAAAPASADDAQLTAIAGQAQIALGFRVEGRRNCEAALRAAEQLRDVSVLRAVRLAAAQARLDTGDPAAALALLRVAEPDLAGLPHSRWRALVLEARADPAKSADYAAAANKELGELARQWGEAAFRKYMQRPDLQEPSRALGRLVASHQ